ncbi:hypothetical protein AB0L75_04030 [Streptomyces sp. NPDC052101]
MTFGLLLLFRFAMLWAGIHLALLAVFFPPAVRKFARRGRWR